MFGLSLRKLMEGVRGERDGAVIRPVRHLIEKDELFLDVSLEKMLQER